MRGFTLAPACAALLAQIESFSVHGPGALPSPGPAPAGLDPENAAFYRELVHAIGVMRANVAIWQDQATYEARAAYQASTGGSAP